MLAGIFLYATSFLFMMLILQGDTAFYAGGAVIVATAAVAATYYNIRIVMSAFEDNLTQGLLYCFAPGYAFYYMLVRWDKCGPNFIATCICTGAMLFGIGLIAIAPMLKPAEEDKDKAGSFHVPRVELHADWA
jgi:hypothetical protein